jgi:hypothetical protein
MPNFILAFLSLVQRAGDGTGWAIVRHILAGRLAHLVDADMNPETLAGQGVVSVHGQSHSQCG